LKCGTKERKLNVDQQKSQQMQRNLFKTSFCIDRFTSFGRKRNQNGTQFRQSLPTIGDDINQEEEEEEAKKEGGMASSNDDGRNGERGNVEVSECIIPTKFIKIQNRVAEDERFVEPDQASIGSASSMEIAVQ
jgi:hypothetical protein